jgi:type II secretory pathway component GspD/PulD (secretin)
MRTAVFFATLPLAAWFVGCSESARQDKWASDPSDAGPTTFSSLDKPSAKNRKTLAPGVISLESADTEAVFKIYQSISGRTIVRPATLPSSKITLRTESPVTILKALQLLDTALAQNGIVMIPQGADVVKAVPPNVAATEAVPICRLKPEELPESSSYTHYIVRLKRLRPRDVAQALQPFAKLPNSILGIDSEQTLMLRDYAVNVRRMLQVLEELESNKLREPFDADWFGTNTSNTNTSSPKPK